MNSNGALEKILHSFEQYYNISTQNVAAPFAAEAIFKSHSEQYFLIKAAKTADIDSNEFVFFYCNGEITDSNPAVTAEKIQEISETAWERGLSRITPYYGHRNSDVTLVILSDEIDENAFQKVKKLNLYKSYKFGFFGWSAFRALAYETSTGRAVTNRRGSDLKKLVGSI